MHTTVIDIGSVVLDLLPRGERLKDFRPWLEVREVRDWWEYSHLTRNRAGLSLKPWKEVTGDFCIGRIGADIFMDADIAVEAVIRIPTPVKSPSMLS